MTFPCTSPAHAGAAVVRFRASAVVRRGAVAGLVLAGGRGRRAGGRDKGLLRDRGQPRAERVLDALGPWCELVAISANRHPSRYRTLAAVVVADRTRDYPGPLAGIAAALRVLRPRALVVCPCDVPELPDDVVPRLLRALRLRGGAVAAVLHDAERLQPLVLAVRGDAVRGIEGYLAAGGRSAHGWLTGVPSAIVRTRATLGNLNLNLE